MEEDAFDFGEINAPRWVDFGSMDTYNEEDSWFQQSESQSKNKAVTDIAAPTMSPIAAHTAVATTTATAKTEKIVEKNLQKVLQKKILLTLCFRYDSLTHITLLEFT